MNAAQHLLVLVVRAYRAAISPVLTAVFGPLGFGCRFTPTCSEYAMEAVKSHGAVKGFGLALGRLCRCHPWGGSGPDPVPPAVPAPGPASHLHGPDSGPDRSNQRPWAGRPALR